MSSFVPWGLAVAVGFLTGLVGPYLPAARVTWPLLMAVAFYPIFVRHAAPGRLGSAVAIALVWAVSGTLGDWVSMRSIGVDAVADRVIRGPGYAADMLTWVETGIGAEGAPSEFIPEHARHYSSFLVASVATGGFLGLAFGTVLLNYMNFYVASLADASSSNAAFLIGWPIWAIVRVVGFIAGASALTHIFYARWLGRHPFHGDRVRRWMIVSVVLVLTDIALKASLAETWRGWLTTLF